MLAVALGVQFAFAWIFGHRAYFNGDDLINAALARELGFSWDFLNQSIFGHWAPGHRALDWFVTNTASLSWPLALLIGIFWLAVTLVFVDRVMVALDTDNRTRWALLLLVACAPLLFHPAMWFAAGMHVLPGVALTTVCIDGFCRYRVTRAPWSLAECIVGFGAGLLFYEVPILLVGYLALLAVVLMPERLGVRSVLRELRPLWPVAAGIVPLALLYTWNYEANVSYPLPHPTATEFADFMWASWSRGFVASAAGIAAEPGSWFGQTIGIVLGQLVALAVVVWTTVRRPVVWRAWVLVLVVFATNAAVVGWGRVGVFYPGIGAEPRYHTVVLPFLVIAIARAFPRVPAAVGTRKDSTEDSKDNSNEERAQSTPGSVRAGAAPRWVPAGVALALVAFVVVAAGSATYIVEHSAGYPIRPWIENARDDLGALENRGVAVSLYDTRVPAWVMPRVLDPHNRAIHVIPQIDDRVVIDPTVTPRYAIGPNGHVRRAGFETLATATLVDATGAPTTRPVCVDPDDAHRSVNATMPDDVGPGRRFLRLRLAPGPTTRFRAYGLEPTGPREATDLRSVVVPAGTESVVLGVNVTELTSVQVNVDPGARVCVTGIDVGIPTAIDPHRD